MMAGKLDKLWVAVIAFLIGVTVAGVVVAWAGYRQGRPVEISAAPAPELRGEIWVIGDVGSPGRYPLEAGDTVEALIQAARGDVSDHSRLELRLLHGPEEAGPQKVDINQAEAWLLQALPGIGEVRARAIIDYRRRNGGFRSVSDLLKVEGIGASIYEEIEDLVTVAD
ncbi:MAG: helix-hairpin-helix domain-containing protein [Chloroflexi bacterium]|nr:helix-hairpin-helix domain-containing protein [Chloroflexota bacterium]